MPLLHLGRNRPVACRLFISLAQSEVGRLDADSVGISLISGDLATVKSARASFAEGAYNGKGHLYRVAEGLFTVMDNLAQVAEVGFTVMNCLANIAEALITRKTSSAGC